MLPGKNLILGKQFRVLDILFKKKKMVKKFDTINLILMKVHSPSAFHLLKRPHRMDSASEASSNRPARGARARAAGAGGPTVAGLTRGGRKQARVRARKTKQLRRTSRKELKVELANVCT